MSLTILSQKTQEDLCTSTYLFWTALTMVVSSARKQVCQAKRWKQSTRTNKTTTTMYLELAITAILLLPSSVQLHVQTTLGLLHKCPS
ncbi:hypothetical protein B0O80DRAFT_450719 [Mortierella sp. GBAus27b]|nr:hypothetical protein B0O80DRAFT_450719 [Mortierella sp. GBAus27b]